MVFRGSSVAGVVALGGLMAGLAGCGGGSTSAAIPNGLTSVRFVNAYQPPTAIDVSKSGQTQLAATGLAYGASTAYQTTTAASVTITAYPTGKTTALVTNAINLPSMISNQLAGVETVVVAGVAGGAHGPTIVRIDDNPPATGNIPAGVAEIKVVNLVPDSTSIGLYDSGGNSSTLVAIAGLQGVTYPNESSPGESSLTGTGYVAFSVSGTPNLTVRESNGNLLTAVTLPTTFAVGHSYTIFVIGEETPVSGGAAVSTLVTQDD